MVAYLPNAIKELFEAKAKKADNDFELEKMKTLAQVSANAEAAKAAADSDARQAEAQARIAEQNVKLSEINANRAAIRTGIKWIDAGDAVVRLAYGALSIVVLVWACWQAWVLQVKIWDEPAIWDIVQAIVYFFIGYSVSAFTCKKVYRGK